MPTFKLDGTEIPFQPGDTIIKAAHRQGIEIPHYCWHPGLTVAANCRMCLVEIEPAANQKPMLLDILRWDPEKNDHVPDRKPKLQPACQMAATDGMSVKSTSSEHVTEARAHVQEYLLLNHPVDCPICDQAGECMLQDYYMSEQRTAKRMLQEPVHKPKAVPFGETIVYDAERCIACTRCIRFCDEVAGDHMLDMRERGNLFEIVVAPGRQLEGRYTMMTEVVCPVGALTTKYWRHKGRVWLLRGTQSVCPGCATGCNMWLDADPREQTAFRNRPRDNEAVNAYWMCDDGMVTYLRIQKNRELAASIGRGKDRAVVPAAEAVARAASDLAKASGKGLAVVLSAQYSSEDNLVLAEFAKAAGAELYLVGRPAWEGDKILRHTDQNPNRAGALSVAGIDGTGRPGAEGSSQAGPGSLKGIRELVADVGAGKITAVLALGPDTELGGAAVERVGNAPSNSGNGAAPPDGSDLAPLGRLGTFVLLTTHKGPLSAHATVVVPVATWGETQGTFVNAKGMAQEFKKALAARGDTLPAWDAIARIGRAMKLELPYKRFADVRGALTARGVQPSPGYVDSSVDPRTLTPRSGV